MKIVSGRYRSESGLTDAVMRLQEESVPSDQIGVVVRGPDGEEEEAEVALESRALEGAVLGGSVGAALGAVGLTLVSTGVIVTPGASVLAAGPALSAIRGAIAGGAVGGGIGTLQGMARFFSKPYLDPEALDEGSAIVSVHSDDLVDVARTVLEETGAERIRVEDEADRD